jgi:glutathione S-transferase
MRAVARLGAGRFPIYGRDVYESSRIDAFLDASLVFARDGQIYLLALNNSAVSSELYGRMKSSFAAYLSGIEQALSLQCTFLIGNNVTLADVCFVAEFCLFHNEQARSSVLETAGLSPLLDDEFPKTYPRSAAHFRRLLGHPAFVPDVSGYLEKIARSGGHIRRRDSI